MIPATRGSLRLTVLAALATTALSNTAIAEDGDRPIQQAQATVPRTFDIAPQSLAGALTQFGQQSGWQVSINTALLEGKTSPGVSGTMTPDQALNRLFSGTGLVPTVNGTTVIVQTSPGTGGAIQLDPVNVQGALIPQQAMIDNLPSPYAGGQVATGAQLGLLGNRSLMDTPFNQTSYTAKKAQDQQARTVRDVLIDDPSVQTITDSSGLSGDSVMIRGFRITSNSYSYGGMYGLLPIWSTMAEIAERVEILKGPSAMLTGMDPNSGIGGTINIVPKRAPDEPLTEMTATYSSAARFGIHADVARRFGGDKQFGVRFNGVFRGGQTAVDNNTDQRGLALLGLDFRGDRVRLAADLGYQDIYWGGIVPQALNLTAGVPIPWAPNASRNFGQPWNYQQTKDLFGVVRGEVDLTERVTAFASFGAHDFRRSALWGGSFLNITSFSGNATSTPQRQGEYNTYWTAQAGLRGSVDTGPITHDWALIGMTLDKAIGTATIAGTSFTTNLYNPFLISRANLAVPVVNKTSTGGQSSIAIVDALSAADNRIQLFAGARLQQVTATNYNATTGLATSSFNQSALTPSVALVVKPFWQNVSFYANWIQGLQQGSIVGSTFVNAGEVFPPFKATQYEAGVKVDWGKFTTTLDIFQITQPSVITNLAANTQVVNGEQRNQGLEFSFFGEPIEGVRLLGGMMMLGAVLTRTQGGLTDGWWAPNTPNLSIRFAGEWDLPYVRGLTLDGRVIYTGPQYIDAAYPRRSLSEWTRFDIGARYTFDNPAARGKPLTARFNIENVLDTSYWMATGFLGDPRTFRLSLTAAF